MTVFDNVTNQVVKDVRAYPSIDKLTMSKFPRRDQSEIQEHLLENLNETRAAMGMRHQVESHYSLAIQTMIDV